MFRIRQANLQDVPVIREIFLASYGSDYSPRFYDESYLAKLLECGDNLVLVAESTETGQALGTGAVDFEGDHGSDLVGHFGRTAVHPTVRQCGIGNLLMKELIWRVRDRIQIGIAEARAAHAHVSRMAENHQFAAVGFLPLKLRLREPESFVLLVRHFGKALELRRSCPRVSPEVYPLAQAALENCGLAANALRVEEATACRPIYRMRKFATERLSAAEYTTVLEGGAYRAAVPGLPRMVRPLASPRMQSPPRAGATSTDQAKFNALTKQSIYLAACEGAGIAGAIEFSVSLYHNTVSIRKIVALDSAGDEALVSLLREAERTWTSEFGGMARVVEINVNAEEIRIQRMLCEFGFIPVAYVPALVPVGTERIDIVKMFRVEGTVGCRTDELTPQSRSMAELVLSGFGMGAANLQTSGKYP